MKKLKMMNSKYRAAIMFFAVMLLVSLVGVSAWLADASGTISNLFDPSVLKIDLGETDTEIDLDDDPTTNTYEMIPDEEGWKTITKDPKITVPKKAVDCWVFATVKEENNIINGKTCVTYEIADGWTQLLDDSDQPVAGVYYRKSQDRPEDQDFGILKDDIVKVNPAITQDEINALTPETQPKLKIGGVAVQLEGFDSPYAAWLAAKGE